MILGYYDTTITFSPLVASNRESNKGPFSGGGHGRGHQR